MNHPAVCIEVIASSVQYAVTCGSFNAGSEETVSTNHGPFLTIMAILMMIVTWLDLILSI